MRIKDLELFKGHEMLVVIIGFLIAGIFIGIGIGSKIERIDNAELRADIEMIKEHGELAAQLERIINIYNMELKKVMDNYIKALKILDSRR